MTKKALLWYTTTLQSRSNSDGASYWGLPGSTNVKYHNMDQDRKGTILIEVK